MFAAFEEFTYWLWGYPLLIAIGAAGLYFTIRSGFFQFRHIGRIITNPFKKTTVTGEKNALTPFQAVSIAVGGSVGVSNISGVGTAIATGGPGALFWLWVAALLGMAIKMAEVTLAVYYRTSNADGEHWGGPTYYMQKALGEERGWKAWKVLAVIFGGGIFITFFITLQNFTIAEAIGTTFKIPYMIPSLVMVACIYAIILGGLKRVGEIAGYMVPFMCIFYVICVIVVLAMNITALPGALGLVFKSAFTAQAAVGGFAGAAVIQAVRLGFARSVYSNEAGWGTSPMIHATAAVEHPVKQGMLGAFEVFVDTIIVCTATGLLVITTGFWNSGLLGSELTLTALEANVGSFARIIIALSIFLFGLTTATGWYTYYLTLLNHAMKDTSPVKKTIMMIYKLLNPVFGCLLTLFTVLGGKTPAEVWVLADFSSVIPTFINVVVLIIIGSKFIELVKDFKARYLGKGTVDPNFAVFYEDKVKAKTK